jgi:hypothetical protein
MNADQCAKEFIGVYLRSSVAKFQSLAGEAP